MSHLSLGERIIALAKERGWSRTELARRVGIEKSHLSRLLRCERNWQLEQLDRVARAFECKLEELVRETDAEGLPDATRGVHRENAALTERLSELSVQHEALKAKAHALENDAQQIEHERDGALRKLRDAITELADLRNRPTRKEYDAVVADRNRLTSESVQLQQHLAESRREAAKLTAQVESLQHSLKTAYSQVQTNYQAYEHWRRQAEGRGAALTGVALGAAGIGLIKLLGGGSNDEDDDE